MMEITDIRALCAMAHARNALVIIDNTFLSPYFQKPLTLGADIVVHSGTKFIGGHHDVISGFTIVKDEEIAAKLRLTYKTVGACLSACLLYTSAKSAGDSLVSLDPTMAVLGLLLAFCLLRYFFASGTAYVTAMVGLFATLILQIPGVDPAQVMLILLVPMGIMGILTPYGLSLIHI